MKFLAQERTLKVIEKELLVANTVKDYTAQFEFDSSWDGFLVRAVFERPNVSKEVFLDENKVCVIPWEVLTEPGCLLVGIYGTQGDIVRPTIWSERLYVREGTKPGESAKEPTPGALEQFKKEVEKLAIKEANINEEGHLIITTLNGDQFDAGKVVQEKKAPVLNEDGVLTFT